MELESMPTANLNPQYKSCSQYKTWDCQLPTWKLFKCVQSVEQNLHLKHAKKKLDSRGFQIAQNCPKTLLKIAQNCSKLLKTAQKPCSKLLKSAQNCSKLLKTAQNCSKLLNLLKTAQNCSKETFWDKLRHFEVILRNFEKCGGIVRHMDR